jgi:hypothetical protein
MKKETDDEKKGATNDERNKRANAKNGKQKIGSERTQHNKFAVGHVKHPRNPPLNVESDRYQRIYASHYQTGNSHIKKRCQHSRTSFTLTVNRLPIAQEFQTAALKGEIAAF